MRRLARAAMLAAAGLLVIARPGSEPAAVAAESCRHAIATASVAWSPASEKAQGVVVRIAYPRSVEVPVPEGSRAPAARVDNLTGVTGGLFDSVRRDGDGDGHGDQVNVGLVAGEIAPGGFARVRFDCVPGAEPPRAGDFSCTSEVAGSGGAIASSCTVALALE